MEMHDDLELCHVRQPRQIHFTCCIFAFIDSVYVLVAQDFGIVQNAT